ncbi:MAG: homoserine kinase [Elusimicrobiota bacterium]|nr:homoserine kinase [Elusimicrobiota bacterium]
MKPFKVKVPATVSNIGSGYDVLGFPVNLFLTVEVEPGEGKYSMEGMCAGIAREHNVLAAAFGAEMDRYEENFPAVDITAKSEIPLKIGLGSSAAARVAGIAAAAVAAGKKLDSAYIARRAAGFEGHPDNAVPAAVGGLTVSNFTDGKELYFNRHEIKTDLKVVLGIPDIEVDTNQSRAALPKKIDFADAVYSNVRSCMLLSALINGRKDLIRSSVDDRLHQPYRKKVIPGYDILVEKTYESGALGTGISGSGPAIFSFAQEKDAPNVGRSMEEVWKSKGVPAKYLIKSIVDTGLKIYE